MKTRRETIRLLAGGMFVCATFSPMRSLAGAGPKKGGARWDFVKNFDRNKDGKVSKEEFTGPPEHFSHFDKNNDGFIDSSESPKRPPSRNPVRDSDKDGDGKLSRDEFRGPAHHFDMFDTNKDGYIESGELPSRRPHQGSPPGGKAAPSE